MSDVAGFDAETRSRVDLRKSGSYRYAEDPSTKILCFSYAFGDERPTSWRPGMKDPKPFLDHIERGGEISGWNIGGFDIPVWNEVCVREYDWPAIRFEQAIDTMAQAAAMHLPQALGDCVREVGLPQDKQKDKRGKYLIQRLCVPKIRRKGGLPIEEYFIDDPKLLSELYDYCDQDVVAERALAKLLRPLTPSEREFWIITQHINARGVPVDVNEIRNILKVVEAEKARLNAQAIEIAGGAFGKMSQLEEVKRWIRSRGVPVGSMDKEAVPVLLEDKSLPKDVRQVIEIHAAINQISIAKYETMLNMVCRDGTIKGGHVYHGASTGRDASRGLNTQNIVRPARSVKKKIAVAHEILGTGDWDKANLYFGHDLMDAAVACVRGVIKAPDGYRFIDVDYSSIENRVGAWVSGHKRKVQMFAEGLDEYRTFASGTMFHIPYEEVTDDQRQFCKPIILGCMFGQGWKGLIEYAKGYGVELSEEDSQNAVNAYREDYKPVQRMWYACGDAAINAVENPGEQFRVGEYLTFRSNRSFLMLRLPSGRVIRWFKPLVQEQQTPWGEMKPVVTAMCVDTFTRRWQRARIIGSSFYQSSVQGIAADIMREGCMRLERNRYPLRMRIHDEYLMQVRIDSRASVDGALKIISAPIPWAPGLPIAGEGWEGPRFKK